MSDSANIAVVRRFYDNLSAPEVLRQVLSPTIRWEIVSGFPHGGEYLAFKPSFKTSLVVCYKTLRSCHRTD